MRTNGGGRLQAARGEQPQAWSSGRIELEVLGHESIVGAVELSRIGLLVLVVARFDTTDEAFLSSSLFPFALSTVERWPELSVAPNPLAELGATAVRTMIGHVQEELAAWEKETAAVSEAMAELAAEGAPALTLQEKPPGVS